MKLVPLQQVRSQLRAGSALPWAIRDGAGQLLLARGHLVRDEAMVAALIERGMFVDAQEAGLQAAAATAAPENYFGRWRGARTRLAALLRQPAAPGFAQGVADCAAELVALGERNPDLLLFLVLRSDAALGSYGVCHALHVAAVCGLLAERLQWDRARRASLLGAALTMNLSMIELQGRLAEQAEPLSAVQRQAIAGHPLASAALLRAAGIDDAVWLTAVEQHHEIPGGGGYPCALDDPDTTAQLLRWADMYVAMHSSRAGRAALPAQQVAREVYTASAGDPLAATIIKAFGIYPPGCYVKLESGEVAVVVRRGDNAAKPLVAALLNRHGDPLAAPVRRDTCQPGHAIVETLDARKVRVRVPAEAYFPGELA